MSKQVYLRYAAPSLGGVAATLNMSGETVTGGGSVCPAAGTIDKLTIDIKTVVSGTGTPTKTFTLAVNGTPSALTGTIAAGASTVVCTGGPITVAAGDLLTIAYTIHGTPNVSSIISVSWIFNSNTANESIYLMGPGLYNTTTPGYIGLFGVGVTRTTTASIGLTVAAAAGVITKLYIGVIAAAGTTGGYNFTIKKNGTLQDGSGGTPNTVINYTCSISATVASSSFSLTVAPGDILQVQIDSISSPSNKTIYISNNFISTNAGESQMVWNNGAPPSANGGSTNFNTISNDFSNPTWDTEDNRKLLLADKFNAYGLQVILLSAPGVGTSRTFETRKNSGSGVNALTISGTSTTGSDLVHTDRYAAGDYFAWYESATSGSPASNGMRVALIQSTAAGNPPGKSQGGSKKSGGGATNSSVPGGTQVQTIGNAGVSSVSS